MPISGQSAIQNGAVSATDEQAIATLKQEVMEEFISSTKLRQWRRKG